MRYRGFLVLLPSAMAAVSVLHAEEWEGVVTATSLNIRSAPDLNAPTISTLKRGDAISLISTGSVTQTIDGVTAPWGKITSPKGSGWIFMAYVGDELQPMWFPVQNGRIILDLKCRASDQPVWDKNVSSLLDGLKRGDRLFGITKNGFVPLKAGDITCSKGECHENYVTVQLDGSETSNEILGAVRDTRYSTVPLELQPADQKECADVLDFKDTEFPKFPEVEEERRCDRLTLSEGSIALATKAFAQNNGLNVYVRKAIVRKGGKKVVIDVDRSTSPLHPLVGLVDQNGRSAILWRKVEGIMLLIDSYPAVELDEHLRGADVRQALYRRWAALRLGHPKRPR